MVGIPKPKTWETFNSTLSLADWFSTWKIAGSWLQFLEFLENNRNDRNFSRSEISDTTEIAEIDRNFGKMYASETSEIMRNFAKRFTETDRNVSRNFGDSEISVETLPVSHCPFSQNIYMQNRYLSFLKPLGIGC